MFRECRDEAEWKKARTMYLTASDAANYCGINPFDNQGQLKLWEEKTGLKARPDISNKGAVQYGKKAEQYLRNLFLLMYARYGWEFYRYDQYGLWVSDEHPFMAATLDCMVKDSKQDIWDLEVKTTTVHNGEALKAWRGGELPINYWVQEIHQMICAPMVVGAITFAHVMTEWNPDESYLITTFHRRDEQDVKDDMPWVLEKAIEMNEMITTKRRPNVVIKI